MDQTMDIHVMLPAATARSMARVARARGLKRAQLLRLAVERYLAQTEREERDAQMRAYVQEMAPHSGEFLKETAAEVRRRMLEDTVRF